MQYTLIDLQKILKKFITNTHYSDKLRVLDSFVYYSNGFFLCKLKLKGSYQNGIYSLTTLERLGTEKQSETEYTYVNYIGSSIDRLLSDESMTMGIMTSHNDLIDIPRHIKPKNNLSAINLFSYKLFILNKKYPNIEKGIKLENLETIYKLGLNNLQYYHESGFIIATDNDYINQVYCYVCKSEQDI